MKLNKNFNLKNFTFLFTLIKNEIINFSFQNNYLFIFIYLFFFCKFYGLELFYLDLSFFKNISTEVLYFDHSANFLYTLFLMFFQSIAEDNFLSIENFCFLNTELLILLLLIVDNFFTYDDYLLILAELNNIDSLLKFDFFFEKKIKNNLYIQSNIQEKILVLKNIYETHKDINNPNFYSSVNSYTDESNIINTTQNESFKNFSYQRFVMTVVTNLLVQNSALELYLNQFKPIFFTQILLLDVTTLFLKKKIFFFFFLNSIFFTLMLINLIWLCTAINLIYALLHFLFFAVLSGLLIILWGSIYIGFCVLLIYGAAIPVLALYIIMLVNVDLIQWLFFVEHVANKIFYNKIFYFFIILFFFITIFTIFFNFENFQFSKFEQIMNLDSTVMYLLLAKRYFNTLSISYTLDSIYDLPLSFYTSDLDKVATAAFKNSSNELIALVFLLLIAIIVVISISRTSTQLDNDYYEIEPNIINTNIFLKFLAHKNFIFFWKVCQNDKLLKFYWAINRKNFFGSFSNADEFLIYQAIREHKIYELEKEEHAKTKYLFFSVDIDWYNYYEYKRLTKFLLKNNLYSKRAPYGTQNPHPDDYDFYVNHYFLVS